MNGPPHHSYVWSQVCGSEGETDVGSGSHDLGTPVIEREFENLTFSETEFESTLKV